MKNLYTFFLILINLSAFTQNWEWVSEVGDYNNQTSTYSKYIGIEKNYENDISLIGSCNAVQNILDSTFLSKISININPQNGKIKSKLFVGDYNPIEVNNTLVKVKSFIINKTDKIVVSENSQYTILTKYSNSTIVWADSINLNHGLIDACVDSNFNTYLLIDVGPNCNIFGKTNLTQITNYLSAGNFIIKIDNNGFLNWYKLNPIYLNTGFNNYERLLGNIVSIKDKIFISKVDANLNKIVILKYDNLSNYYGIIDTILTNGFFSKLDLAKTDNNSFFISFRYSNNVIINSAIGFSGLGSLVIKFDENAQVKFVKEFNSHTVTSIAATKKSLGIAGLIGHSNVLNSKNIPYIYRFIASIDQENGNFNFTDTIKDIYGNRYGKLPMLYADQESFYILDAYNYGYNVKFGQLSFTTPDKNYLAKISDNVSKSFQVILSTNPANYGNVTGSGTYDYNQNVTIIANPNPNYKFVNWTENGTLLSITNTYSFTVQSNRNIVANFENIKDTISAISNPSNSGSTTGQGIVNRGDQVTLTASANNGFNFTNWTENGVLLSSTNPLVYISNGNRNIQANFEKIKDTVSLFLSPSNGGTTTGQGIVNRGDQVTLNAIANNGFIFTSWTENGVLVTYSNPLIYISNGNRSFQANFSNSTNASIINGNDEIIKLYPNPANSNLFIDLLNSKYTNLKIINQFGQTILSKGLINQKNQINISQISKGNYIIQLSNPQGENFYQKLTIE